MCGTGQGFSADVSYVFSRGYMNNFDVALGDMFVDIVMLYVDMFSSGMSFS